MTQMTDLPAGEDFQHIVDLRRLDDGEVMAQVKTHVLKYAISKFKGNLTQAALWLGVSRAMIYRKVGRNG